MSYENGIYLNSKHSYIDFKAWLKSKKISYPAKKKITETVPYMQGVYDFSLLYDNQVYEERTLEYEFELVANKTEYGFQKEELNARTTEFINWLKESPKVKLIDDDFPGYFFMAEAEESIEPEEKFMTATISVKFKAYSFKIKMDYEGNTKWDTFNFLYDTLQETQFDINGSKNITLINNGSKSVIPEINCLGYFTIEHDSKTYKVSSGVTKDYRFKLFKGENKISVFGKGTIEFKYRIEVL